MLIKNVRPLINATIHGLSDIQVMNGKISAIAKPNTLTDSQFYDMDGAVIAAGYIDIHTHGGGGHDMMEGTFEAIDTIAKYHLSTGTTSFCPTTLTAEISDTVNALSNIASYKQDNSARLLGAHLEGPYLSPKSAGAHPPRLILNPNPANTEWIWQNKSKVARITTAPDNSGASWLTSECLNNNIQVSIGHDASIDDEIYACIDKGASSVTHMYNCTSRPSRRTSPHKHLGLTEIGLISDKLVCEIIADNRHVPNALFGMIYKLKGCHGICLISDSLSVAGMGEGEFYLGSGDSKQRLKVEDGVATLPDLNTYAGSVTAISAMVKNLVNNVGIPLCEAVTMGTKVPADLLKLSDRGDIRVDYLADFNVIGNDGAIIHTILGGKFIN